MERIKSQPNKIFATADRCEKNKELSNKILGVISCKKVHKPINTRNAQGIEPLGNRLLSWDRNSPYLSYRNYKGEINTFKVGHGNILEATKRRGSWQEMHESGTRRNSVSQMKRKGRELLRKIYKRKSSPLLKNEIKINSQRDNKLQSIVQRGLNKKYRMTSETYGAKIVRDMILNESTHVVSQFKDYLIMDDANEFLKRMYNQTESQIRLPKIFNFYNKCTKIFPNYCILKRRHILYKGIQRKQRVIDQIQKRIKAKKLPVDDYIETSNKVFTSKFLESMKHSLSVYHSYISALPSFCAESTIICQQEETNKMPSSNLQELKLMELLGLLEKQESRLIFQCSQPRVPNRKHFCFKLERGSELNLRQTEGRSSQEPSKLIFSPSKKGSAIKISSPVQPKQIPEHKRTNSESKVKKIKFEKDNCGQYIENRRKSSIPSQRTINEMLSTNPLGSKQRLPRQTSPGYSNFLSQGMQNNPFLSRLITQRKTVDLRPCYQKVIPLANASTRRPSINPIPSPFYSSIHERFNSTQSSQKPIVLSKRAHKPLHFKMDTLFQKIPVFRQPSLGNRRSIE